MSDVVAGGARLLAMTAKDRVLLYSGLRIWRVLRGVECIARVSLLHVLFIQGPYGKLRYCVTERGSLSMPVVDNISPAVSTLRTLGIRPCRSHGLAVQLRTRIRRTQDTTRARRVQWASRRRRASCVRANLPSDAPEGGRTGGDD